MGELADGLGWAVAVVRVPLGSGSPLREVRALGDVAGEGPALAEAEASPSALSLINISQPPRPLTTSYAFSSFEQTQSIANQHTRYIPPPCTGD
ncbi:hypothetical protein PV703_20360, partial [Streptomyces sp. ME01-24h]|nr:hypothetical protein [Streptomyces sp. ME01-24h]